MPEPIKPICGEPGPHGATCTRTAPHRVHRGWSEDVAFMAVTWESETTRIASPDADEPPRRWSVVTVGGVKMPTFNGKFVIAGDVLTREAEAALVALVEDQTQLRDERDALKAMVEECRELVPDLTGRTQAELAMIVGWPEGHYRRRI